jgi:hypothetical protein
VGVYGTSHLIRLELIGRLQERGYSLAGIRDLLAAWRDGGDLGEVLGLSPDQLVHVDEPGAPATADQLARVVPDLVPARLDELVATGVVEACGPARYCVPSPSLLQLGVDVLAAGLDPGDVLALLARLGAAADTAAEAVLDALARVPAGVDDAVIEGVVARGRGLLAHGVGRLTLQRLARRAGAPDHATTVEVAAVLRRQAHGSAKSRKR